MAAKTSAAARYKTQWMTARVQTTTFTARCLVDKDEIWWMRNCSSSLSAPLTIPGSGRKPRMIATLTRKGYYDKYLYAYINVIYGGESETCTEDCLRETDMKILKCKMCIEAADGTKKHVSEQENEMLSEASAGRLVKVEELFDPANRLIADNGSLTIMCCLTVVRSFTDEFRIVNIDRCGEVGQRYKSQSSVGIRLYRQGLFSDVIVYAGNSRFPAHRAVLAAESSVFRAMFEDGINGQTVGERRVDIDDLEAEVIEDMLAFMYTGNAPNMKRLSAKLLVAANKNDLVKLQVECKMPVLNGTMAVIMPSPTDNAVWPPKPLTSWKTCKATIKTLTSELTLKSVSSKLTQRSGNYYFGRNDGLPPLCFLDARNSCVYLNRTALELVVGDKIVYYKAWFETSDGRINVLMENRGLVEPGRLKLHKVSENALKSAKDELTFKLTIGYATKNSAFLPEFKVANEDHLGEGVRIQAGLFSDVIISVKYCLFPAHRAVLVAASDVFRAMFEAGGMKEESKRRVYIDDLESDVVEDMLTFIYTAESSNLETLADQLLVAADKYDLTVFKAVCEDQLASTLTAQNAIEILIVAHHHDAKRLRASAISWIARHADRMLMDWKQLEKYDMKLALETLKFIVKRLAVVLESNNFHADCIAARRYGTVKMEDLSNVRMLMLYVNNAEYKSLELNNPCEAKQMLN